MVSASPPPRGSSEERDERRLAFLRREVARRERDGRQAREDYQAGGVTMRASPPIQGRRAVPPPRCGQEKKGSSSVGIKGGDDEGRSEGKVEETSERENTIAPELSKKPTPPSYPNETSRRVAAVSRFPPVGPGGGASTYRPTYTNPREHIYGCVLPQISGVLLQEARAVAPAEMKPSPSKLGAETPTSLPPIKTDTLEEKVMAVLHQCHASGVSCTSGGHMQMLFNQKYDEPFRLPRGMRLKPWLKSIAGIRVYDCGSAWYPMLQMEHWTPA